MSFHCWGFICVINTITVNQRIEGLEWSLKYLFQLDTGRALQSHFESNEYLGPPPFYRDSLQACPSLVEVVPSSSVLPSKDCFQGLTSLWYQSHTPRRTSKHNSSCQLNPNTTEELEFFCLDLHTYFCGEEAEGRRKRQFLLKQTFETIFNLWTRQPAFTKTDWGIRRWKQLPWTNLWSSSPYFHSEDLYMLLLLWIKHPINFQKLS